MQIFLLKSLCFYLLLTFINKYVYLLNIFLQIKILLYLIIYIVVLCAPHRLPHPDVMPAGCPSGRSSTTSRGSCLPSFTILATIKGKPPQPAGEAACHPSPPSQLLEAHPPPPAGEAACRISPARLHPVLGTLLAVLHPIGGILPHDHRQGARTSLLRAAGRLAPESKLQE